jgi:hypothetical protein
MSSGCHNTTSVLSADVFYDNNLYEKVVVANIAITEHRIHENICWTKYKQEARKVNGRWSISYKHSHKNRLISVVLFDNWRIQSVSLKKVHSFDVNG